MDAHCLTVPWDSEWDSLRRRVLNHWKFVYWSHKATSFDEFHTTVGDHATVLLHASGDSTDWKKLISNQHNDGTVTLCGTKFATAEISVDLHCSATVGMAKQGVGTGTAQGQSFMTFHRGCWFHKFQSKGYELAFQEAHILRGWRNDSWWHAEIGCTCSTCGRYTWQLQLNQALIRL